ncbi:HAE1 family hydrophobic/amphiphilic exporter-1 [Taibaiella chishuiensis]|uniref:HAE1 family hydrophobic/amphiphilic exporter-1 n=2 Tax=Taibaiella chishuiensis TaxID=1434707 RepID=A0A2P8D8J5_9BACT|nr:HAE1 family hydrophobic/amphiphilic exporter-1 [Taibaiella chishuiensis]
MVIFIALTFLGIISYSWLNYELTPDMSMSLFSVTTAYPGASPGEVETGITKKIEDAVSGIDNIDAIKSTSLEGLSQVTIQLKTDADVEQAMQDAQRKLNAVTKDLPAAAKPPAIGKFSMTDMPIMRFGVTARMNPTELYALIKDEIKPDLTKVKGVARVDLAGGEERVIKVNINRARAEQYQVSLLQVNQAIGNGNLEFPAGKLSNDQSETSIKLKGKYQSIADIRNLVIRTDPATGSRIRLSDIASVEDGVKDISTYNRIDGKNSIGLQLIKQRDANTVAVAKAVKEILQAVEQRYANRQLKFDIANDSSEFTIAAADLVMVDFFLAIVIVAAVMLLFLHSLRNSLIVMISIPASLLSVFIAMNLLGYTINLLTLMAISLVIGILVDDSIVVLENIYRHLEKGKDRVQAAIDGRQEIGFTAVAITLVDVIVFLPLTLVGGIISNMLGQYAMVIVIATLMSLFVSFTLTPLLASRLARISHPAPGSLPGRIRNAFESRLDKITHSYGRMLAKALVKKRWVLGSALVLIFASFLLVGGGFIGGEFAANGDKGEVLINLELPQSATLQQTNEMVKKVETILFQKQEVQKVYASVGTSSGTMGGSRNTQNKAEINVKLVPREQRRESSDLFAHYTKLQLEKVLPGVKVNSAIMNMMGTSNEAPVSLVVSGNDPDKIYAAALAIAGKLKTIKGTSDVKLSVEKGSTELQVLIDRDKMAGLGLSMDAVGMAMNIAFSGNTDVKYSEQQKEYDIDIAYDKFDRGNEESLRNLSFINAAGQSVKLAQFAQFQYGMAAKQLDRKDRMPSVTITAQVLGVTPGAITGELDPFIRQARFDKDVHIDAEGEMKYMKETFSNLGMALIASILLVYLVMVMLYNSFVYPFVVFFSIPVAIIGALLALALTMQTLNFFSLLGMIMLIGLVAKNGILIVDFTNQLKAKGKNTVEALIISGKARLRPILMTTLAMIFGMLPIALASGAGSEWKNGLAWVLIGGLTSSMLLTLFVVPSIYLLVDLMKGDIKRKEIRPFIDATDPDAPILDTL